MILNSIRKYLDKKLDSLFKYKKELNANIELTILHFTDTFVDLHFSKEILNLYELDIQTISENLVAFISS
jgi:hypothetical protein